jgi:hypothetical protein
VTASSVTMLARDGEIEPKPTETRIRATRAAQYSYREARGGAVAPVASGSVAGPTAEPAGADAAPPRPARSGGDVDTSAMIPPRH